MTRDEAIIAAREWLDQRGIADYPLRYARYMWDFRSGLGLACDRLVQHFVFIPSPFGHDHDGPNIFWLEHGWLIVFNPGGQEARNPEDCVVVWVDENGSSIRGRLP